MSDTGGFIAGSIVAKLLMDKTGWDKAIGEVGKDSKRLSDDIGKQFATTGKFMAAGGAAIVGAFGAIVSKAADAGDAVWDLSQKTGISTELLSSYKLATEKAGSSIGGFAIGMRILANNMLNVKNGLPAAKKTFDDLGVSVLNVDGTLRPLNDVILDVADRLSKMKDGAEKTAIAQDIFGRSGSELIPLLNQGAEGLKSETERAEKLGIVLGRDAAAAGDRFNDSLVEVKASVSGLGIAIGQSLMPIAEKLVKFFTEIVVDIREFAEKNGPLTDSIVGMSSVFGLLLTAVGSFQFLLGTIIIKLPLVTAAIGTTTGALVQSTLAWTAGAAAVAYYISKLLELEEEQARLRAGEVGLAEQQGQVIAQLQEAARRTMEAGREMVTSADMDKIIASYARFGDNAVNMARSAILEGKHGVELQKMMRQVADESKAAYEKVHPALKTIADNIDKIKVGMLTFTPEPLITYNEAAVNLKDTFEEAEEAAVELGKGILGINFDNIIPRYQAVKDSLNLTFSFEIKQRIDDIVYALRQFKDVLAPEEIKRLGMELLRLEASLGKMALDWSKFFSTLESSWSNTIATIFEGGVSLANGLKQLWIDIRNAFFDMVAAMIAKWAMFEAMKAAFNIFGLNLFAEGFHGIVSTATPFIAGEAGPERVDVTPISEMGPSFSSAPALAGAVAGGGSLSLSGTVNLYANGYSRRDLEEAGEELKKIIDGQLRRIGRRI